MNSIMKIILLCLSLFTMSGCSDNPAENPNPPPPTQPGSPPDG